ncbi:MAG: Lysine-tRNA ligase [Microgenomates group bacterium GW2011_GWF2_45_18]|nr:MAG: Lysine-tRNA ligase [Microgenomates group bacterium GW2011_GWF1_44_10]KKU02403.1 MAG: Lysine-tRNA ligase [Microgenomates group bacterium GW2011_GWF2_45_18]OGJ41728.1 MAG: hypothetical protein A2378_02550 [Candidatus Pacebacteria bacterium RIFOXYB1_FULL_44_10]HAU99130.1 hypothetical protein [Candidatus Paceibacterota bacterium]HAX01660.1 hypothetical protein [Candidatus Paceibacterota bacterium]
MKLEITKQIFDQFPDVLLGVVVVNDIDNSGSSQDITDLLREAETSLINKVSNIPVTELPYVVPWREAYRKFGAKPKDYPSSIENLIRRISKGEQVRHINKLVDIYNIISLKHVIPVGGEDLQKIEGDVLLTIATDHEQPIVLLGEKEARPPYINEVIYKDNNGTICRRWNWKEADRTKLTEETRNAVLVLEALPPIFRSELELATKELAMLVEKYCGGNVRWEILDSKVNEIVISK